MAEEKNAAEAKQAAKPKQPKGEAGAKKPAAAKAAAPKAPKAAKPKPAPGGKTVKVRLLRSGIGTPKDQRATLLGLGLKRMRQERELKDSAAVRGMIFKVRHLISVDGQPVAGG